MHFCTFTLHYHSIKNSLREVLKEEFPNHLQNLKDIPASKTKTPKIRSYPNSFMYTIRPNKPNAIYYLRKHLIKKNTYQKTQIKMISKKYLKMKDH